jgi:hypothetical protein
MQQWVVDVEKNFTRNDDHKFDDIWLALKLDDYVVGYLSAQHYVTRQLIVMSYLSYDQNVKEACNHGVQVLLEGLLESIRAPTPWRAVIGEVERSKPERKNNESDVFAAFKRYERKMGGRLFMVDFNYIQPAVRPSDMGVTVADAPCLEQRLLYFTRDVDGLIVNASGGYALSGKDAVNLLETVICCLYGDAFPESDEYQEYLRDVLAAHLPDLERGVNLVERIERRGWRALGAARSSSLPSKAGTTH